jgi:Tfp pilus assembly protein PilF
MTRAQDAVEANDLDRARDMYDRAITIKPDYPEAWHRRARVFANDGKYDEAIADLEGALRAEPRHFGAWIGLGAIFESVQRPDAALKAYRRALAVHPFATAAKQGEGRLTVAVEGRAL